MPRGPVCLIALLLAAVPASASGQAEGEPGVAAADPPPPEAPPTPTEVTAEEGHVRARAGDTLVWESPVVPASERGSLELPSPVVHGDAVLYCLRGHAWRARLADGVVTRRWVLPGSCDRLEVGEEGVEAHVSDHDVIE